jgi:hypothetical protein
VREYSLTAHLTKWAIVPDMAWLPQNRIMMTEKYYFGTVAMVTAEECAALVVHTIGVLERASNAVSVRPSAWTEFVFFTEETDGTWALWTYKKDCLAAGSDSALFGRVFRQALISAGYAVTRPMLY